MASFILRWIATLVLTLTSALALASPAESPVQ